MKEISQKRYTKNLIVIYMLLSIRKIFGNAKKKFSRRSKCKDLQFWTMMKIKL